MGKFVEPDDVIERYEGEFPDDRSTWLDHRIDDVEADLILMVPSLGVDVGEIASIRLQRVKALVADKVLELFRNPERLVQHTTTFGPLSESLGYQNNRVASRGYFTEAEVVGVRARSRRSNLGVARIAPFIPGARPWC